MENADLGTLLNQSITNKINGMFTCIPCQVVGQPNLEEQRVDVKPLVNRVTTDGVSREHPPILGVPLVFPGSESSQFTFPVVAGDTVLCVFSQRSIARFKLGSDTPTDPMDFGKYSRNDAIAIPGLFTFPKARNNPSHRTLSHSVEDTVVVHNIGSGSECEVRLKKSGDVIINTPGKAEVNCATSVVNASSNADINTPTTNISGDVNIGGNTVIGGNTTIQGNTTISGGMTAKGTSTLEGGATIGGIVFASHRHDGDSGGTTSGPK